MTIEDTLLGIAIGDAFGFGLEFGDRDWIRENINFKSFVNTRSKKKSKNIKPGIYSDDTEHTIGVVKAIMDERPFSEELLLEYWKAEYESDMKEKGFPREGHGSIKHYYTGEKTIDEIREFQENRVDPGNAPAMRAVPIGFVGSNKINDYAIINADATHPHPLARASSILVARAAEYLIVQKGDEKKVIFHCKKLIDDAEMIYFLELVDSFPHPNNLSTGEYEILCGPQPITFHNKKIYGLPCSSLRTGISVLYTLKHSNDAFEGLKNAVQMGGDVDSLAAVCTGILAGKHGLKSLPSFMLDEVEGVEKIKSLAADFEQYLNNKGSKR
ncbi:MAG: ADP-ribosylglycohydrolase family protein [Nanoarchaeota archaeon]|nr:ADP-ribosylglycohydrolase family protein [Nanoarchaeota archaeon]MBU1030635.1 ADP-ribosylglycohydrolase family protein [Nanoarchaeota archaeon]MBU1849363.1 ADP-ribosylglycohydrolase family protein [Nanoarchaeota archaeon]